MSAFGDLLRERRLASGLSQRQLAKQIGVDFSYISKLENDRVPPPASETIARLAVEIGARAEDLFAAARRVPEPEPEAAMARQADAIRFFRQAAQLELSGDDWKYLLAVAERRAALSGPAPGAGPPEAEPSGPVETGPDTQGEP